MSFLKNSVQSTKYMIVLLAISKLAVATPIPDATMSASGRTSFEDGSACMLVGNQTLYPLGLRVGIYLQWFATIFANFFVPQVARDMRGINTLLQLGVFIGTCIATVTLPTLSAMEGFILLTFCIGSITSLTTSPHMNIRVTRLGSICRLLIFVAVFTFGSWFWFTGIKGLVVTNCTQDTQFVFFWRVNIFHWFKHFSQSLMIIGTIFFIGLTAWELFSLVRVLGDQGSNAVFNGMVDGTLYKDSVLGGALQQERYAWVSGALLIIMLVIMAAFVSTIEGGLRYSNAILVWNFDSVVELIPFVIGLFSMLKVCLGMFKNTYSMVQNTKSGNSVSFGEKGLPSRPGTGTTLV